MSTSAGAYFLVIGDRDPLRWILLHGKMAFPPHRVADANRLRVGDHLFLYTTRGCFRNPTRDRGRIIGDVRVKESPSRLDEPVTFADRTFPVGCGVEIVSLAPLGQGVELSKLVDRLEVFPDPATWAIRMRRVLVPLPSNDARLVLRTLANVVVAPNAAVGTYL